MRFKFTLSLIASVAVGSLSATWPARNSRASSQRPWMNKALAPTRRADSNKRRPTVTIAARKRLRILRIPSALKEKLRNANHENDAGCRPVRRLVGPKRHRLQGCRPLSDWRHWRVGFYQHRQPRAPALRLAF